MNSTEPKEKKNLLIELGKRKAAVKTSANRFGVLGQDLSARFAKTDSARRYTWRGGRNGSGKP